MSKQETRDPLDSKHCQFIVMRFRYLAGEILTIIDASIHDSRQNKAIKDLMKRSIYGSIAETREYFGDNSGEANPSLESISVIK